MSDFLKLTFSDGKAVYVRQTAILAISEYETGLSQAKSVVFTCNDGEENGFHVVETPEEIFSCMSESVKCQKHGLYHKGMCPMCLKVDLETNIDAETLQKLFDEMEKKDK